MNSDNENECTFPYSTFKVEEYKVSLFFWIRWHLRDIWAFWHCMTCKRGFRYLHEITISQRACIFLKWGLIQKIKAPYFLQLLKLKKEKCTHFHDQSSSWWVMLIVLFHGDTRKPLRSHKRQKAHISLKWRQIKKIKALYFLQLLTH